MVMSGESSLPVTVLRVAFGLSFVVAGAFTAVNWQDSVHFNALLTGPRLASVSTAVAVVLVLAGGFSFLFGLRMRLGALLLLLFLVPASVRHVVAAQEATQLADRLEARLGRTELVESVHNLGRRGQLACFVKNVGLAGVALFVLLGGLETGTRPQRRSRNDSSGVSGEPGVSDHELDRHRHLVSGSRQWYY